MGKNKIVQANYLIDKKGPLTINEKRIFYSMLRLIKKEDKDFKRMVIPISDMCEEWGIDEKGYYTRFMDATESLARRVIRDKYIDENGKEIEFIMPIISYAEYAKGSGQIVLEIHESMKPYLLELSKDFTQMEFDDLKNLDSKAMQFLEILSKFRWIKIWTTTPAQFKRAMQIDPDNYTEVADLERKIIIPCVSQLNENTHINVEYKKHGRGQKATFAFMIEVEDEAEKPKRKKVAEKHRYGDYKHVLLTDDEFEKIKAKFPDWERRINDLDYYLGSKGKSYKSHYMTILKWARDDDQKKKVNSEKPYMGPNGVVIDPTMPNILDEVMSEGNSK